MKTRYLFLIIIALLVGCKENSYEGFENKGSVYFQVNDDNWLRVDSVMNYSFAGKPQTTDTIWLRVNLLGDPSSEDRAFKLGVDPTTNTAVEGTHYEAFKDNYLIAAGEMTTRVPVIIYKTDDMEDETIKLSVVLVATDQLELGLQGRLKMTINMSDFLMEPVWWSTPQADYYDVKAEDYYGPYSRTKHELCIQILGQDFPEDILTFLGDEYWIAAMAHMSQYFADNYPVYDENGNVIEPW